MRHPIVRAALLSTALAALSAAAPAAPQRPATAADRCERVYVGTQNGGPGQGIMTAALDTTTGQLSGVRLAAEVLRPTWLLADRTRPLLYSVSDPRDPPGAGPQVLAYAVDRTSGDLQPVGATAPGGQGPTHLALDRASRTLFVAHYGSGQVSALPLTSAGGPLAPASIVQNTGTGPTPRQSSPHAHAVALDPSGRYLLSPDLGADRVLVYRFDPRTRQLTPAATPWAQLPPGTGPRHIVFGRNGRFAYLVSEMSAEVRTFRWDAAIGKLTELQVLALDAPGFTGTKSGAEIALSPDGAHLYVSNRGDDTIVGYAVDRRTGMLSEIQRASFGGKLPWSFGIAPDGRWLLVASQGTDAVTVLPLDPATGRLSPSVGSAPVPKAVTVAFAGGATRCL